MSSNPGLGSGAVVGLMSPPSTHPLGLLSSLCLAGCGVGDEGAACLATSLATHCPHVSGLDVSRNDVTCAGAVELARLAPRLGSLRLAGNAVADAGMGVRLFRVRIAGVTPHIQ